MISQYSPDMRQDGLQVAAEGNANSAIRVNAVVQLITVCLTELTYTDITLELQDRPICA